MSHPIKKGTDPKQTGNPFRDCLSEIRTPLEAADINKTAMRNYAGSGSLWEPTVHAGEANEMELTFNQKRKKA
jgi:hypothetical protein